MDAKQIQNALFGSRKNKVLTDDVKSQIKTMVTQGKSVSEITKALNGNKTKEDEGFVRYQAVYGFLKRELEKLEKANA